MTNRRREKLKFVFVYNADSGVFNLLADIAHKMFSPRTYSCRLCALTHSNLGMKKQWKDFLESVDAEMEFLHADEFKDKYDFQETELPAVYKQDANGDLEIMIDAFAINKCKSLDDLIGHFKLDNKLENNT